MDIKSYSNLLYLVVLSLILQGCIDPVKPEFDYKLGLIYVDALASTSPGSSYVYVYKTIEEFGSNKNVFESGASVSFINETSGAEIICAELDEVYLPPPDYSAQIGETWSLRVRLADGNEIRSEPETIINSVEISDLKVAYNPELVFSNEFDEFVPGHSISVSFNDPPNEENYYYWRYRSFEKLINCKICYNSYYREEQCIVPANPSSIKPYFTYACDPMCWQIRYSESISIFSDKFSDGRTTTDLDVANILLYTKEDILVELQQFALTPAAYSYFKTLKDIVDDNGSLNAPIPAALVGNLYYPGNSEEFALGRFTAAATGVETVYIDRTFIQEEQLEDFVSGAYEEFGGGTPVPIQTKAPCEEGNYSTSIQPNGWPD